MLTPVHTGENVILTHPYLHTVLLFAIIPTKQLTEEILLEEPELFRWIYNKAERAEESSCYQFNKTMTDTCHSSKSEHINT